MDKKVINSQLSNFKTYKAYLDKMMLLAMNVFQFNGLDDFIDKSVMNYELVTKGSIAFFYDEIVEKVLCLPYSNISKLDMYGRPTKIMVRAKNGTYYRSLKQDEFVIMYDNESHLSIFPNILMSAERLALIKRTVDINIAQQKTPRIWKTSEENQKTIKSLLNKIDSNVNEVTTYDSINLDGLDGVLLPAPYVTDKLNEAKEEEWGEFLNLIGVANVSVEKKERLIKDEVMISMGGTIASRYSRFASRKKAIDMINAKWGTNIEVEFYDGLPTTLQTPNYLEESYEENEESEVESND